MMLTPSLVASGVGLSEHTPNSTEPTACLPRIRVTNIDRNLLGVTQMRGCTHFSVTARTGQGEAPCGPGERNWHTVWFWLRQCGTRGGGVTIREPRSGDGTRSPVYYPDSAGLVSPWLRARALHGVRWIRWPRACCLTARKAADPDIGGSWQDAGCRWRLRVVSWVALAGRRVPWHHRDRVQPGFGHCGWRDRQDRRTLSATSFPSPWPRPTQRSSAMCTAALARRIRPSGSRRSRPSCPPASRP